MSHPDFFAHVNLQRTKFLALFTAFHHMNIVAKESVQKENGDTEMIYLLFEDFI